MQVFRRKRKKVSFKLLNSFLYRLLFGGMFAYYLTEFAEKPFFMQLGFIVVCCIISIIVDYWMIEPKNSIEVSIDGEKLLLLGVKIDISEVTEILYSQTKRFEHTVRFSYKNLTYQDFELASSDLIEDLRFYDFLVDHQLPVKMLDNNERLNEH